jgi:hypothetical protein
MQPVWHARPIPPNDAKAITALVLGILCLVGTFCWMGVPLGVPAIILGALALRDIRRSDGMLGGGGMAIAGIVMGSIGALVFVCWVGFLGVAFYSASKVAPLVPPVPVAPTAPVATAPPALLPPGGWGRIHVVALHPSASQTLRAQLADEMRAAKTAGESVLVETIAPACAACVEIARAMPEPELQTALSSVRIVHVDVDEFGLEAASLHLHTPTLPWFYVIDSHGDPRDGISADEWDDNDADEIAPVLQAFVQRKLSTRRHAWGGAGGGGTTL